MSESPSLRDRYLDLIDQIVQMTLKGQIRSKEQVFQMLSDGVAVGTGEVFERCLGDRLETFEQQSKTKDELKQAKATRSLRALQTVRGEWERWQQQNQASAALMTAVQEVLGAGTGDDAPGGRLQALLRVLDPNRPHPLNLSQWQQLAKLLPQKVQQLEVATPELQVEIQDMAQGLTQGLDNWHRLENHLVSWIYEQGQGQLGFGGVPGDRGPWAVWAKQVNSPLLKAFFQQLALEQSVSDWISHTSDFGVAALVEWVVVLRCLQQGLVAWFDKLVYDSKVGAKLSISTFLGFAVIWSQLGNGLSRSTSLNATNRSRLADGCLQVTLQILRTFAQRDYFPLYGGIFASFSGQSLRDALNYLDEPLKRAEKTQEKARILTLLGYSQRAQGRIEQAIAFHQQALVIAREAGDSVCEIASLNHLSRTYVAQSNYSEAINYSQRALILSRQSGDRPGEANALANLGYSEVFQAQQLEAEPEVYEMAVNYLQQGLQLSERLGDRQSLALCLSSLGIAYVVLEQLPEAIACLEKGVQAAQFSGDLYLQGVSLAYLAEAHYRLQHHPQAIAFGCIGMYLLEQIVSNSWRQPAGLLTVLRGQLGDEAFRSILGQQRSQIIAVIGVDGYDYLPELLKRYQQEG
ncbi:tetratricopeptide repeat protein [Oscillatoria sp. FACHB-1407]|uniref:tetratricopeptide repeat protein n=1 Tax=Oscillatoria sp. FACHB-1407 TaxID=2692847 RepID=UPI00168643F5|nr:tetratricopeptide repeat protein [Oscillatoria sp. FACHB-1407]MBD2459597.1 tetratricopeptide repeat protein [Oscillatoria sp. FACHB-1407]